MGRILARYLFVETLIPFAFGLAVFTSVLLIARILKLVEMVVNRGVPAVEILKLFSLILPAFLEVTIPMALLLAILMALGRLSADSEIVAMKTSGLSLYQLAIPIGIFTLLTFAVTLWVSTSIRPWANGALRAQMLQVAQTRATAGFKEKVFNDDFPGLVIYADEIEPGGSTLRGVLIADSRNPNDRNTVLAQVGLLIPSQGRDAITLRLLRGTIYGTSGRSYQRTDFNVYDYTLDLSVLASMRGGQKHRPEEMGLATLRARISELEAAGEPATAERLELHRKLSIPFACVVFALVGIPVGIQPARSVRSRGFAVSLLVIFLYYAVLTIGQTLAESGSVSPATGLWAPNLAFLAFGLTLFRQAARETPLEILDRVAATWTALRRWLQARWEAAVGA